MFDRSTRFVLPWGHNNKDVVELGGHRLWRKRLFSVLENDHYNVVSDVPLLLELLHLKVSVGQEDGRKSF